MYYSLESLSDAFDLLIACYIYSCLALVLLLFIGQTVSTLALVKHDRTFLSAQSNQRSEPNADFYQQVKELLNTGSVSCEDPSFCDRFETSTIRELHAYIKEHQLQPVIRVRLGKSVSIANKLELITCLNSITS